MDVRPSTYISGAWQMGEETVTVTDSADGSVVGEISLGTVEHAGAAVEAAHEAFPSWAATPLAERREMLQQLTDGLEARSQQIADTATAEVGSIMSFSQRVQAGLPVRVLRGTIEAMEDLQRDEVIGTSRVRGLPIGVTAAVTPWNYPLYQIMGKLAPALAAGCTMVVKPPQQAPLTAYDLVEELEKAGFPAGVVNVVQGRGPVVGEAFAGHPLVDLVSFTGSTGAGSRIAEVAARSVKKVALELGGKSANIFTGNADLDKAVPGAVKGFTMNNGQTCAALTRLIVLRSMLGEVEERVAAEVAALVLGDPRDEATTVGPMVSAGQRQTVEEYISRGLAGEGRLIAGGLGLADELQGGHYVLPTVFTDVDPKATIAQEEIFGPVLVIHAVADEDEAIRVANDSPYGLSGGVWSVDTGHAARIARRIRTGQVSINGASFNAAAPFGGFKQSGYGRELGHHGLAEYVGPQSLQFP